MPKLPAVARVGGKSKKDQLKEKKKASAKSAKRVRRDEMAIASEKDSSDDDSSDDDDAPKQPPPAKKPPAKKPPAKQPPAKKLVQAKYKYKLTLGELPSDDPLASAEPVEPPLTAANAATRFVFVPASEFGSEGIAGWSAKITGVSRDKKQTTNIAFMDGDGRKETQYFTFEHVLATFKPLS